MRNINVFFFVCGWFLSAALMPITTSAKAHILSAGFGSINIRHDDLILLIAIPISILTDVDDNHDGLLQPDEIRRHRVDILNQFAASFIIRVDGVEWSVSDDELLVSLHTDSLGSTSQIEWWQRRLKPDVTPSNSCVEIAANWFNESVPEQQNLTYLIKVHRDEQSEILALTKDLHHFLVLCNH